MTRKLPRRPFTASLIVGLVVLSALADNRATGQAVTGTVIELDKKTGAIAWEMELPAGVSNAPMTYMVKGKQYIVVGISGWQHPGELVALTLP